MPFSNISTVSRRNPEREILMTHAQAKLIARALMAGLAGDLFTARERDEVQALADMASEKPEPNITEGWCL